MKLTSYCALATVVVAVATTPAFAGSLRSLEEDDDVSGFRAGRPATVSKPASGVKPSTGAGWGYANTGAATAGSILGALLPNLWLRNNNNDNNNGGGKSRTIILEDEEGGERAIRIPAQAWGALANFAGGVATGVIPSLFQGNMGNGQRTFAIEDGEDIE